MSPVRVGIVVGAIAVLLAFFAGLDLLTVGGLAVLLGLIAFLDAYEWDYADRVEFGRTMTTVAPVAAPDGPSIDLSDDLEDLLRSASYRAQRLLEDTGSLAPFVMYQDADGSVRTRKVDEPDPLKVLTAARRVALAIDETVPRVIIVTAARAQVGRRSRHVIAYEAGERGYRERTIAFTQPYTPGRLVLGGRVHGQPAYAGELPHPLRQAKRYAPTGGQQVPAKAVT